MKKNYFRLLAVLFAAIVSGGLVSCGDDDEKDNGGQGGTVTPVTPEEPSKDEVMSSADQKEYLEKVALDFMSMMPASDFNDISELAEYIRDTYADNYDWRAVEVWADEALDAAREALGGQTTESKTETWGSSTYNYVYTNYMALIMASNFTGHFTARDGRWVQEDASDLQFIFSDNRGQQCVIKLETSGSRKNVHVAEDDSWDDYEYNSSGNTYTSTNYYDRTQFIVAVPERIVVTLTQAGREVVKTTVNINLASISGEEFNIRSNSLTASTLVELNNGYKFDVQNVASTANSKAAVSFVMSKNGTALVTLAVASDVRDIPSVNVSAFSARSFDADDYDFDKANAKKAYVKLDLIGKVQIQGTVSDVRKLVDYMEEAHGSRSNESTFKSYVNQANSLADVGLFYDGKSLKQATVRMEPFVEEAWNGRTYWEAKPVICFFDGTSYSTLEVFFNEKDFKATIDAFKSLANRYANLVGERIYW